MLPLCRGLFCSTWVLARCKSTKCLCGCHCRRTLGSIGGARRPVGLDVILPTAGVASLMLVKSISSQSRRTNPANNFHRFVQPCSKTGAAMRPLAIASTAFCGLRSLDLDHNDTSGVGPSCTHTLERASCYIRLHPARRVDAPHSRGVTECAVMMGAVAAEDGGLTPAAAAVSGRITTYGDADNFGQRHATQDAQTRAEKDVALAGNQRNKR